MLIQEAIKSGRPFRRTSYHWLRIENGLPFCENGSLVHFSDQDILADDWEVKSEPVVLECEWQSSLNIPVVYPAIKQWISDKPCHGITSLIGKRTRVTIEVIE